MSVVPVGEDSFALSFSSNGGLSEKYGVSSGLAMVGCFLMSRFSIFMAELVSLVAFPRLLRAFCSKWALAPKFVDGIGNANPTCGGITLRHNCSTSDLGELHPHQVGQLANTQGNPGDTTSETFSAMKMMENPDIKNTSPRGQTIRHATTFRSVHHLAQNLGKMNPHQMGQLANTQRNPRSVTDGTISAMKMPEIMKSKTPPP